LAFGLPQSAAAVAGVQKLFCQQSSLVPFFQVNSLVPLRQLSTACAETTPEAVTAASHLSSYKLIEENYEQAL